MKKELPDSFEAIKDPGEVRNQPFAVELMDMTIPCLRGLNSPRV